MFNQNIFRERMKNLRIERNLTLKEFGSIFGISKQSASKWEAGINLPSISNLFDIAETFNVSIDYLLGLSDTPTRK